MMKELKFDKLDEETGDITKRRKGSMLTNITWNKYLNWWKVSHYSSENCWNFVVRFLQVKTNRHNSAFEIKSIVFHSNLKL